MDFNEIINEIGLNDFTFGIFFLGYLWCLLFGLLCSLTDYLNERSWRVIDYEKVIYNNLKTYDVVSNKEKLIVSQAINNYELRIRKNKRFVMLKDKFLNLFKKNK